MGEKVKLLMVNKSQLIFYKKKINKSQLKNK